ncbi:hypothetical protein CDCA_CDCA01G0132 [Cyanidium caldarium]|uniref:monogalactosyldiacylglycerol synthase n=1 Tax=Cyanidium caldarium TaxID=2771 RepID=A0AAV9IPC3_CYACA|nr:hypothetical protein CDCA_CDCA01G0132 [Cyanidium caldarium]
MYVPVVSFPREAWAPHPRWTQWLAGQLGACRARYRPTTSFPERAPPPPNRGGPFISRGAASARSTATVFLANLWLDGSLGTTDASGGSGPNGGNGPPTPSLAHGDGPADEPERFWGATRARPHESLADAVTDSNSTATAPRRLRALLLISDTGGGHRASANALRDAIQQLCPNAFDVFIVDMWVEWTLWPFTSLPESYQFLAKNPPLWRAAYCYGELPMTRRLTEEVANALAHERVRAALACVRPDIVVSLHPLTQNLPLRVMRRMGLRGRVPFVTVVTDLGGAHPTWFHPEADRVFVASEAVQQLALKRGVPPACIRQCGLPVRREFWSDASGDAATAAGDGYQPLPDPLLRQRLLESRYAWRLRLGGLDADRKTILVVGGGDGVGGLGRIAEAVVRRLDGVSRERAARGNPVRFQVVVVCGKNERLRRHLEVGMRERNPVAGPTRGAVAASSASLVTRVLVHGFVGNMGEWMAAADAIITKAGPGTIAEALTRGLPIMLSGFLPGQEEGNVPYVVDNGVGEYRRGPEAIAQGIAEWMADEERLLQMAVRARRLGRPHATYEIGREVVDMAREWPGYPDTAEVVDGIEAAHRPAPEQHPVDRGLRRWARTARAIGKAGMGRGPMAMGACRARSVPQPV